jgi:hypothetical protein
MIQRNWEFGSALTKLLNFGGEGFEPTNPHSVRHWAKVEKSGTQKQELFIRQASWLGGQNF